MKKLFTASIILITCLSSFSQSEEKFSPAIEGNSMFIEEAFNQEDTTVHHISNLVFLPNIKDKFHYAFTQEWPAFGLQHQLSYTLKYNFFNQGREKGIGDVLINYRYQLSYKESFIVSSPRISLIIPTGDRKKGFGFGSWGLQGNLPLSKRWTDKFINHFNMGTTVLFRLSNAENNENLVNYFGGISSIWLITEKFNLLLETFGTMDGFQSAGNKINYYGEGIVAPGFRYAIDIKELQIVTGITVPFSFAEGSKTEPGAFFYFSLEHPY